MYLHQAKLLRSIREKSGLSQEAFAKKLFSGYKTMAQAVSNIERGKCGFPSKHTKTLCDAFGVNPEEVATAAASDTYGKFMNAYGKAEILEAVPEANLDRVR